MNKQKRKKYELMAIMTALNGVDRHLEKGNIDGAIRHLSGILEILRKLRKIYGSDSKESGK